MKRLPLSTLLFAFIVLGAGLLGMSCSGGPPSPGSGFQTAEGTGFVFIGDAPPAGTSILKFEITLSNATLCPTVGAAGECTGSPQVSLISAPVEIEMTQLELESAFLSLKTVAAGSYAGVRLVFSNPELKLLMPDGTIQELEGANLPLVPTSVTPLFPSGLTVSDDTNFGFLIDFNVQDSIQSSAAGAVTGISPAVSLVRQTFTTQQPVEEIEDATGTVSSVNKTCASGTGSFTLTDSITGLPVTGVQFDLTTEFDDGASCETLANGQVVEVDIELRSQNASTAVFFAKEIELSNDVDEDGLEGTVLQVNSLSQFVLLVDHSEGIAGIPGGAVVVVSFDPPTTEFKLDSDGLPAESSLFTGGGHLLLAGQKVELDVVSFVVGGNNCATVADTCTATVNEVKLKKSTFTALVGPTIVNPNFALVTLPSIFGTQFPLVTRPLSADCQSCLIETLTVRTSEKTEYENLPGGFTGLLTGSTVTVRGFLLKNGFTGPFPTGTPLLVAEKIRLVTAAL